MKKTDIEMLKEASMNIFELQRKLKRTEDESYFVICDLLRSAWQLIDLITDYQPIRRPF